MYNYWFIFLQCDVITYRLFTNLLQHLYESWLGSRTVLNKYEHSWAQQKLSPLSPLNILLSINGPLLSFGFNELND